MIEEIYNDNLLFWGFITSFHLSAIGLTLITIGIIKDIKNFVKQSNSSF